MSAERHPVEKKFSFTGMKNSLMNFVNTQIFRFEKKNIEEKMREPVNNHFKTPEQMEADFSMEMNPVYSIQKEYSVEEIYLMTIDLTQRKDGYTNIPDLVNVNAACLEENY